jgi:hypothetical protein
MLSFCMLSGPDIGDSDAYRGLVDEREKGCKE